MSLTQTTASAAIAAGDTKITVASATGFAAGNYVVVDGEVMRVSSAYLSGTSILLDGRGLNGTVVGSHPTSAKVLTGLPSDFDNAGAQGLTTYQIAGRGRTVTSYSASGAIALPSTPSTDVLVELNGTSALAMTVAAPTKDLEGVALIIASNGAANHTVTFTGGLSGAGASYDVITINATAPVVLGPFYAINGLWQATVAVPMAGTVTNITATVA